MIQRGDGNYSTSDSPLTPLSLANRYGACILSSSIGVFLSVACVHGPSRRRRRTVVTARVTTGGRPAAIRPQVAADRTDCRLGNTDANNSQREPNRTDSDRVRGGTMTNHHQQRTAARRRDTSQPAEPLLTPPTSVLARRRRTPHQRCRTLASCAVLRHSPSAGEVLHMSQLCAGESASGAPGPHGARHDEATHQQQMRGRRGSQIISINEGMGMTTSG